MALYNISVYSVANILFISSYYLTYHINDYDFKRISKNSYLNKLKFTLQLIIVVKL